MKRIPLPRVLGLIPARGGSKGVPRKNIRPLLGKPLLQYTAESARTARRLSRLVLTTDDPEIAEVGRRCGLEVPFLRPAELSADDTPTFPVVQHALRWLLESGDSYDAVCILQPTCPIRPPGLIDACIERLEETGADSIVTVLPVPSAHNPHWVYFQNGNGLLRLSTGERTPIASRQDLPPAFHREGSVYVTIGRAILEGNSLLGHQLVGYPLDPSGTVNIDDFDDWARAEQLLARSSDGSL